MSATNEEHSRFSKSGQAVIGGGRVVAMCHRSVDLDVGIVMGIAFTAVVCSLVADVVMPFAGVAVTLRAPNASSCATLGVDRNNINTIAQLQAVGGISWNYGRFIQFLISFLVTAVIVFLAVKAYTEVFLHVAPALVAKTPATKKCAMCTETIPAAALRCKFCTSDQGMPEIVDHGKSA
ncbi:hypothetical protein SmJEL517_g00592 [Synchytrium microbalum]|uniref:Large conductance mechanosensitive channel protein n=1 Tax=Synchytrium microbalum TaxID=1806994 RepID=A0A507CIS4_9FUNG|nr:uncharacterized protein SmJEL517_g00592 [Synchytrium microbalum]TPX37645.1 hypothetical protein SmJEL517_g00592 [Synchytrium microbalum]